VPRSYPPGFRARVLALVEAGRPIKQVAEMLGISDQTIYSWRRRHLIDTGRAPGIPGSEKRRADRGPPAHRRARERAGRPSPRRGAARRRGAPKRRFEAIAVMADEGLPVQLAVRVLCVSESGYYRWKKHTASARSLRHAFPTEIIGAVHTASRGVYGARRVHAEPTLGRGIAASPGTVELLTGRAGLKGLPGNKTRRPKPEADRGRPRPTQSNAPSTATRATTCGSPTSPSTPRGRARRTARSCSTPTPAA
jgi:putative transposase